jgi:hypothetical protein
MSLNTLDHQKLIHKQFGLVSRQVGFGSHLKLNIGNKWSHPFYQYNIIEKFGILESRF